MIVAVTGASGFVGGHIVRELIQTHTVHAYARRTLPKNDAYIFHQVDITKPFTLPKGCNIVIHAAAISDLHASKKRATLTNELGTKNVILAAKKAGVSHLIYISTASIYDVTQNKYRVRETFACAGNKNNWYSKTKYSAEQLVVASGIPATILRPHIVYGESDTSILPGILANAKKNKLLVPIAKPKEISITYIGNLTAVVSQICKRSPTTTQAYNVADDAYITNMDFLSFIIKTTGTYSIKKIPIKLALALAYVPGLLSVNAATIRQLNQHSSVSVQKLLENGYKLPYSQQQGLQRFAKWYTKTNSYKQHHGNTHDVWPDYLV